MNKTRQPLSQGLAATLAQKFIADPESVQSPQTIPIELLQVPAKQSRRYFDPNKQAQLVKSIEEHGILEPLLVRPLPNGNYELVAGERRYRAAQELKLSNVPIVSKELDDGQARQVALIENLQREDLNPIEETEAILELLSITLNVSNDQVASILHRANHAKNRNQELEENVFLKLQTIESVLTSIGRFSAESFRTSRLPLLNLPTDILEAMRSGQIEYTKARAIAKVLVQEQRKQILEEAIANHLSLSEIKLKIKEIGQQTASDSSTKPKATSTKELADDTFRRLKKSQVWDDPKKKAKIEKLLLQLNALIEENSN
nr:ParB/RepB/Spo0J family partition protein [Nostoc sp. EkiNYC01]